jgi:hypothetical protein
MKLSMLRGTVLLGAITLLVACQEEPTPIVAPEPLEYDVHYSFTLSHQEGDYTIDELQFIDAEGREVTVSQPDERWRKDVRVPSGSTIGLKVRTSWSPQAVGVASVWMAGKTLDGATTVVVEDECAIANGEMQCVLELRHQLP